MPFLPEQPDRLADEELPAALIAELRSTAMRNVPAVPAAMDAQILREVKAGFARRNRFRLASRIVIGVATAAAALAIALPLVRQADQSGTAPPQGSVATKMLGVMPAPAEDVDHNGKVDILDAFVVAKLVKTGKQIDAVYDVNGDGKVDQLDVDRIAHAAVAVTPHSGEERRVQ